MFRLVKLNFQYYIKKKKKATHEIVKRLFDDSVKYNGSSSIDGKETAQ